MTAMHNAIRTCPLCGRDNQDQPAASYSREHWRIKTCARCEFVYLENAAAYEELAEDFAWSRTKLSERDLKLQREPLLIGTERRIRRLRKRLFGKRDKAMEYLREFVGAGEFLDVGCGHGEYIRRGAPELRGSGIDLDVEAAAEADASARSVGGRVVCAAALAGLKEFAADSFDGVLMRAYLEHETEPRAVLAEVFRVLRPGGLSVIQVPNFGCINRRVRGSRWCGFRFPDHVNYFVPQTLERMVREAGLDIARFRFRDRPPLSDRMWMIAARPTRRAA